MGAHERDVTPDLLAKDMLTNPMNYRQGYKQYYEDVMSRRNQGLPDAVKQIYEKQGKGAIGGQLRSGREALRSMLAGTGAGTPIDALMSGYGNLQSQANQSLSALTDQIAMRDYDARERNLDRLGGLSDMEARAYAQMLGGALNQQQIGIGATEQKNNSGFNWQALTGGLFSAGTNVLGGEMKRKNSDPNNSGTNVNEPSYT